jgi:hypothetical protein
MLATRQRHVGDTCQCRMSVFFESTHTCRSDTEESTTYPIYINNSQQVQIIPKVPSTVNHKINNMLGKEPTCTIVSFWTPLPTQHLAESQTSPWPIYVGNMMATRHSPPAFGQTKIVTPTSDIMGEGHQATRRVALPILGGKLRSRHPQG